RGDLQLLRPPVIPHQNSRHRLRLSPYPPRTAATRSTYVHQRHGLCGVGPEAGVEWLGRGGGWRASLPAALWPIAILPNQIARDHAGGIGAALVASGRAKVRTHTTETPRRDTRRPSASLRPSAISPFPGSPYLPLTSPRSHPNSRRSRAARLDGR